MTIRLHLTRGLALAALVLPAAPAAAQFSFGGVRLPVCAPAPDPVYDESTTEHAPIESPSVVYCPRFDPARCADSAYVQGDCFQEHRRLGFSCRDAAVSA
ncbi:MAG: hypothetical protein H6719_38590, partial [Sandaracinaceae bacterium]|nr:hypothetical protein [Sandaracinaceae bacterium]